MKTIHFIFFVIIIILHPESIEAQTKIWGAGAPVGQTAGTFQQNFTETGILGNYSDTAWTALSIFDSDTTFPGNAYWRRSTLGYSQGAYWTGTTPINSPSQANGAAIFDSDYLDNAGVVGAFGTGTSPARHRGELISPLIDLTGYTDSALIVKFYGLCRAYEVDEFSISMSLDSGQTWSASVDLTKNENDLSNGWVRANFHDITTGVSNLSNCRIRFVFEGYYYFSILDDVSIEVAPEYDIALPKADPNSSNLVEHGDFVKISNNSYFACFNLLSYNLNEWFYGTRAVNYGSKNLYPSDSARIRLEIDFIDPVSSQITASVYLDTLYFSDTLFSNAANSLAKTEQLRNLFFLYTYGAGAYRCKYWLEHDLQDVYGDNDTVFHTFHITEYIPTYNYISKARMSSVDNKVYASKAVFPPNPDLEWLEYGSMYYFPSGGDDEIKIDSLDFRYYIPYNYTGDTTLTLFANIYRFEDGFNGGIADGKVDSNLTEFLQVGLGVINLTGLGTNKPADSYHLTTVSQFVDAGTGGPMLPFVNNGYYLVTILDAPYLVGGNPLIDSFSTVWRGVDEYNYAMNLSTTSTALPVAHPSVTIMRDSSTSTLSCNWLGMGQDVVPSIGIHTSGLIIGHSTQEVKSTEMELELSPNPTNDYINIHIKNNEATNTQFILTDISGRIIQTFEHKSILDHQQRIDVKNLPLGVYLITAKTAVSSTTKSFVKK